MTDTPIWEFEHRITHPNGTRVEVRISVPRGVSPRAIADSAEYAQMAASRAMTQVEKATEEVPF